MAKLTNMALCHEFAHNPMQNAENANGTMFIEQGTIYSYGHHFPMATDINGFILVTNDSYSNTTAKQMRDLRSAIRHRTIFVVEDVKPTCKKDHVANFKDYVERYDTLLEKASRARSNKEWLLDRAVSLATEANQYADTFKLRNKRIDTSAIDLESIKEIVSAKKLADKKAKEKAERAKVKALKQQVTDWQNNVPNVRAPYSLDTFLLRVKGDNIETSRHANIPLCIVRPIWDAIQHTIATKQDYIGTGTEKVGNYTLRGISKKGDLLVDCHYIKYEEIKRIAIQLGYCS